MRDVFEEIYANEPADPMVSARQDPSRSLRKRFYKNADAGTEAGEGGYPVLLDGKPVRTPLRRYLAAPSRALAQALADEWNAQVETIDPGKMPLTRLANAIIDAVADQPGPVADEIANYLGSDLVCYRADAPEGLIAAQTAQWDPILDWARDELGARFIQVEGVIHAAQPKEAIAAARKAIPMDAWRLGAVSSITTLTGSALLALALAHKAADIDAAWAAAHLDEDWQMTQWGRDEMALKRRAYRFTEMQAAAAVLTLLDS